RPALTILDTPHDVTEIDAEVQAVLKEFGAMYFKQRISLIMHSCASLGVVETFKALARNLAISAANALRANIDSNYDKRNSIDTASEIGNAELEMADQDAQSHATVYRTTPERFIAYLISRLGINYKDYDFIDVGCGKGRVLLVASSFPFRS